MPIAKSVWRENGSLIVLMLFLALVFLSGGGARSDIKSLAIIRPIAAFVLAYGLFHLRSEHFNRYRFLFIMFTSITVLTAVQLIPLPPSLWQNLPGRQIIIDTERLVGLPTVWRPISMVPQATWNALFSLMIPCGILLLIPQISQRQTNKLLLLIIMFGLLSGIIGIMQAGQPDDSRYYFYRITNFGSSVGLFANRNHHATLLSLLFPLLAYFASVKQTKLLTAQLRWLFAISVGVMLIPLLLISGSRAGLALAILSMMLAPFCYQRPYKTELFGTFFAKRYITPLLLLIGVFSIVAVTIFMARSFAITRLLTTDFATEFRYQIWVPIFEQAIAFLPLGSGMGSFVEVFQIVEPVDLLTPTYVNHAHNDWLEAVLNGGVPALILLLIAIWAWTKTAFSLIFRLDKSDSNIRIARVGAFLVLLLALASIGDYPLRVPSLAAIFAISAVWMSSHNNLLPKSRLHLQK